MVDEPLSVRLVEVCEALITTLDDDTRRAVLAVQGNLREPLRVAVVGRVKAGKSTLVNALIGSHVAPTAATECTQVVTWYRFGRPAGAQVVMRDGGIRPLPLVDGLPETLGVPIDEVDRLEVRLPQRALRGLTLVDTPGLATLTEGLGEATRAAVLGETASRRVTGDVDAILFVFRDVEKDDEVGFLRSFAAATGTLGASAVNAIGILSHADSFGSGAYGEEDPMDSAASAAVRLAADRQGDLADVVPVAGLLAETGRTGQLSERAVAALGRLAPVDDTRLRLWERLSPHHAVDVDDATMRTLLHLLGPYGLRHARRVAPAGAQAVYGWLDARSGISRLEQVLADRFALRADALKVGRGLAALDRLVYDPELPLASRRQLADVVERVRFEPLFHRIKELRSVEAMRRHPDADPNVVATLERLLTGGSPEQVLGLPQGTDVVTLHAEAIRWATWGSGLAGSAGPHLDLAEAGRVISRSFTLLADRFGGPAGRP